MEKHFVKINSKSKKRKQKKTKLKCAFKKKCESERKTWCFHVQKKTNYVNVKKCVFLLNKN